MRAAAAADLNPCPRLLLAPALAAPALLFLTGQRRRPAPHERRSADAGSGWGRAGAAGRAHLLLHRSCRLESLYRLSEQRRLSAGPASYTAVEIPTGNNKRPVNAELQKKVSQTSYFKVTQTV